MKIQSNPLELRILKTLATSNKRQLGKLVRVLNPKCFQSNTGQEVYSRIMTLARDRGIVIGWDELCEDPALNENTRKRLQKYKKRPIKNLEKLDYAIGTLNNYRKMRAAYDSAEYTLKELNKEKVDADIVMLGAKALLDDATYSSDTKDWFTDVGGSDAKARKAIRKLLADSSSHYIPTGLKEFDNRNIGIPRGTFFVIQTNSGGGKSVMANQLCGNMALQGARACLVPLEMTSEDNLRRHVARVTDTEMGKVINTRQLSKVEKLKIKKYWMGYHKKIKKAGGLLSIFAPKEDMTIEDILFTLKPRNYDVIIIDYIGLLKGTDGEDQARKLGAAGRFCKRFADINDMCVGVCAQLSDDNKVRYSRAINEHSGLSFSWQYDAKVRESKIIKVELPKSRNQNSKPFYLKEEFEYMRFGEVDEKDTPEEAKPGRVKSNKFAEEKNKRHHQSEKTRDKTKEKEKKKNRELVSESDFFT